MSRLWAGVTLAAIVLAAWAGVAWAAGAEPLAAGQSRVRDRMAGLERRLLELTLFLEAERGAPFPAAAEPGADRLRRALTASREGRIVAHMAEARDLLAARRYAEAAALQQAVLEDLERLAALLAQSADEGRLEQLLEAARRLGDLAERQSALAGQAERAPPGGLPALAAEQLALAEATQGLLARLAGTPAATALSAATGEMRAAEQALRSEADLGDVLGAQRAAERDLREALALVQAAIRRREAERQAEVRARVREMLEAMRAEQDDVRAATADLHAERAGGRADRLWRLKLSELAERQAGLAAQACDALGVADAGDPTAPALPVALRELEADVRACADLMRAGEAGQPVPFIQQSIVGALDALIAALRYERAPPLEPPDEPPQTRPAGDPPQPGVDVRAELRLVRALQASARQRVLAIRGLLAGGGRAPLALSSLPERVAVLQSRVGGLLASTAEAVRARPTALSARLDGLGRVSGGAEALLGEGHAGERVLTLQQRVLAGLDALLAAGQPSVVPPEPIPVAGGEAPMLQPGAMTGVPRQAAEQSVLSAGDWRYGRLRHPPGAGERWLPQLPEAERQKVADAFTTGRLPERYRGLLSAYNRSLAEEGGQP